MAIGCLFLVVIDIINILRFAAKAKNRRLALCRAFERMGS
jgi:hypothetical protein